MAIKIIRKQKRKSSKRVISLKATVEKYEEERLAKTFEVEVTDEMYAMLLELSQKQNGDLFDFLRVHPYCIYRKLEQYNYVTVANKNGGHRWKVARITDKGATFVGGRKTNRQRRRRRAR